LRLVVIVSLLFVAVAGSACGGSDRTQRLIEKLPSLVTSQDQVEAAYPEQRDLVVRTTSSENSPNELAAEIGPSLYYRRDAEALKDAGRIAGHVAGYFLGPPGMSISGARCCASVTASANLYRSVDWAHAAISTRPFIATGLEYPITQIGDSAVAWPLAGGGPGADFNENTRCPCLVVFRVGRLVGTVSVRNLGPPTSSQDVSPLAIEFALAMAKRFREALEE